MSKCTGWLLGFNGDSRVAIGQRELLHLIDEPEMHEVPCAPAHARHVLFWEQGLLPVFDVGAWSNLATTKAHGGIVAIVGFRSDANSPLALGGLLLMSAPRRIDVDDAWACPLPQDLAHLRSVSCACFESEGQPVPVLDLSRLFTLAPSVL
jgi:hypothetical protein